MTDLGLISTTAIVILPFTAKAQHLYYRLDIATNNVYSFAISNLVTAGLNALTNEMLFDNAYTYTYIQKIENEESMKIRSPNVFGLSAKDIFSDITTGGKLGYQSFSPGTFNWGLYGSVHFRLNQHMSKIEQTNENYKNNIQRVLMGGGLLFNIGSVESNTRLAIEASLRYEIPVHYKGMNGLHHSDMLNKGFSSHYAIRINGKGHLQGLGIYADIPHYNLFKKSGMQYGTPNIKMYSFGIMYTITPWKIKEIYH
jgi:hypothetical protein